MRGKERERERKSGEKGGEKLIIRKFGFISLLIPKYFLDRDIRIAIGINYTIGTCLSENNMSPRSATCGNHNRLTVITIVMLQMCRRYILLLLRDGLIVSFVIGSLNYFDRLTLQRHYHATVHYVRVIPLVLR